MQTPSYRKNALILSILLGVVFICCLLFIFLFPHAESGDDMTALIYQDGTLLHSIPLGQVKEPYQITVAGETGNYNRIEIRPGSIGIVYATCPDKLCMHMGFQETSLLPITCLPNKLVIRLTPSTNSVDIATDGDILHELDGVAY